MKTMHLVTSSIAAICVAASASQAMAQASGPQLLAAQDRTQDQDRLRDQDKDRTKDQDRLRDQDQDRLRTEQQVRDQLEPWSLLTDQERVQFHNQMHAAKTEQDRERIRTEHQATIRQRAADVGMSGGGGSGFMWQALSDQERLRFHEQMRKAGSDAEREQIRNRYRVIIREQARDMGADLPDWAGGAAPVAPAASTVRSPSRPQVTPPMPQRAPMAPKPRPRGGRPQG